MKKLIYILLFTLILGSCAIEPAKITYGSDACHFCTMTIVDQQHAAEIVSSKGKAFKYDAIECMLNDLKTRDHSDIELFLVTDYLNPATLIDAHMATYLISTTIKSPMGANLSAYVTKQDAQKFVKLEADQVLNWQEIQQQNFN